MQKLCVFAMSIILGAMATSALAAPPDRGRGPSDDFDGPPPPHRRPARRDDREDGPPPRRGEDRDSYDRRPPRPEFGAGQRDPRREDRDLRPARRFAREGAMRRSGRRGYEMPGRPFDLRDDRGSYGRRMDQRRFSPPPPTPRREFSDRRETRDDGPEPYRRGESSRGEFGSRQFGPGEFGPRAERQPFDMRRPGPDRSMPERAPQRGRMSGETMRGSAMRRGGDLQDDEGPMPPSPRRLRDRGQSDDEMAPPPGRGGRQAPDEEQAPQGRRRGAPPVRDRQEQADRDPPARQPRAGGRFAPAPRDEAAPDDRASSPQERSTPDRRWRRSQTQESTPPRSSRSAPDPRWRRGNAGARADAPPAQ